MTNQDENKGPQKRKSGWLLICLGLVIGVLLIGIGGAVFDEPYEIGGGAELDEPGGPTILVDEPVNPTASDVNPSDGVIDLSPGARFESSGTTYASVSGWDNDRLILDNMDVSDASLSITDGRTVDIEGDATRMEMRDYALGETAVDVETSGDTTLTLDAPDSSADYIVLTDSTGDVLASADSNEDRISTTISTNREIIIEERNLSIDNPQPADGENVSESPVQLSVDVEVPDAGSPADVTFYDAGDDSEIGTDQLQESGTATAEWSNIDGGPNEWYAVVEDSLGNSEEINPKTVNLPDTLEVRDEENPSELITDAEVTLEFYIEGSDESVTRTASDGEVDMQGLPANEQFIAVASADGYDDRRIYVPSIIESQEIYLLPESVDSVETEFDLTDFTGDYPSSDSVLEVQRSIDGEWQTVQGDFFGASGRWEAILAEGERHRFVVTNVKTDDSRELGAFTPQRPTTQSLVVNIDGSVDVLEAVEQINFDPALASIPASETASVTVDIEEGEQEISSWTITVEHVESGSSTTLDSATGSAEGSQEFELDLSDKSGEIVTTVEYETENGDELATQKVHNIREHFEDGTGLLGAITSINASLGGDSSGTTLMISFLATTLITGAVAAKTRASPEVTGFTALGSISAFWTIGWLPTEVFFVAATAFAATAALRRGI